MDVPLQPVFLVGIGASAGGLDAIRKFFSHLPSNTLAAYFVVTHLARDQKTYLPEILRKCTKMPVVQVDRPLRLAAGTVYTLMPNNLMEITAEGVAIRQRPVSDPINRAIDTFFISIAAEYGNRAIGIIFSGGGEDGAIGCIEIKKAGGIVLVQSPESSEVNGMPWAVILRHEPYAILPPEELAVKVFDILTLGDGDTTGRKSLDGML
jgi:chemotaxis response regulator CheB